MRRDMSEDQLLKKLTESYHSIEDDLDEEIKTHDRMGSFTSTGKSSSAGPLTRSGKISSKPTSSKPERGLDRPRAGVYEEETAVTIDTLRPKLGVEGVEGGDLELYLSAIEGDEELISLTLDAADSLSDQEIAAMVKGQHYIGDGSNPGDVEGFVDFIKTSMDDATYAGEMDKEDFWSERGRGLNFLQFLKGEAEAEGNSEVSAWLSQKEDEYFSQQN